MSALFSLPVRIYYEDTDAGGVVYYANYLKFMERARTEWLRAIGFEQDQLMRDNRIVFAVHKVNIEYLKPAYFNDELRVEVTISQCSKASIMFDQNIIRADHVQICRGQVRIVCVNMRTFFPQAMPAAIYDIVESGVTKQ